MPENKYLKYFKVISLFNTKRTRDIFQVNPTVVPQREEAAEIQIHIFDYSASHFEEKKLDHVTDSFPLRDNGHVSWINIDGIRKADVDTICNHFNIHMLIHEDILSVGQRPKMDEMDPILFCLLNMLYFNEQTGAVETEQISIVLEIGRAHV